LSYSVSLWPFQALSPPGHRPKSQPPFQPPPKKSRPIRTGGSRRWHLLIPTGTYSHRGGGAHPGLELDLGSWEAAALGRLRAGW
jgi:hypothetical protein